MKKRLIWTILSIAAILFTVAGCKLPFWSELYGTWTYTSGGDSMTLDFSFSEMTWEMSGSSTGTAVFSLDDVNEAANHILATLESATGVFAPGAPIGEKYYSTYSISGDELYYSGSTGDYPASATEGPFIKE